MADIRDAINLCDEIEFNNESDQDVTKEEFVEEKNNLPVLAKQGLWARFKAFWFQEIELSEIIKKQLHIYKPKAENEIKESSYVGNALRKIHDLLFMEITFGKKNAEV